MSEVPHTRAAYDRLRRAIERHDRLYYVEARPEISDREYDALFAALVAAERAHPEWVDATSPTQRVSETPLGGFRTVRHSAPMLSLDNGYSDEDLAEFHARVTQGARDRGRPVRRRAQDRRRRRRAPLRGRHVRRRHHARQRGRGRRRDAEPAHAARPAAGARGRAAGRVRGARRGLLRARSLRGDQRGARGGRRGRLRQSPQPRRRHAQAAGRARGGPARPHLLRVRLARPAGAGRVDAGRVAGRPAPDGPARQPARRARPWHRGRAQGDRALEDGRGAGWPTTPTGWW